MIVIVPCPTCHGEGFLYTGQYEDERCTGICPNCIGACEIEEEAEPRTLMDLEQEDYDMLEAKAK